MSNLRVDYPVHVVPNWYIGTLDFKVDQLCLKVIGYDYNGGRAYVAEHARDSDFEYGHGDSELAAIRDLLTSMVETHRLLLSVKDHLAPMMLKRFLYLDSIIRAAKG